MYRNNSRGENSAVQLQSISTSNLIMINELNECFNSDVLKKLNTIQGLSLVK